jgi:transcriptional regulator with GAF, ATPase, and Fis domain
MPTVRRSPRWPRHRRRQSWLAVLTRIAEDVQSARSTQEAADTIVRAGCQLGFRRARLWLLVDEGQTLLGASHTPDPTIEGFVGLRLPVSSSIYTRRLVSEREPRIFTGQELGAWLLMEHFAMRGFRAPVGEWVHLPLWIGGQCWGFLTLDNAEEPSVIPRERRTLLRSFGLLLATALDRTRLSEKERRQRYEIDWLANLIAIAEKSQHARTVQEVADVVATETLRLGFRRSRLWLLSREGHTLIGVSQAGNEGLDRFSGTLLPLDESPSLRQVLEQPVPIYLRGKEHGDSFLYRHFGRHGYRPPSGDWVGIPLIAGAACLGALILDHDDQVRDLRRSASRSAQRSTAPTRATRAAGRGS